MLTAGRVFLVSLMFLTVGDVLVGRSGMSLSVLFDLLRLPAEVLLVS